MSCKTVFTLWFTKCFCGLFYEYLTFSIEHFIKNRTDWLASQGHGMLTLSWSDLLLPPSYLFPSLELFFQPVKPGLRGAGGEITRIKWNLAWFALEKQRVCVHGLAYEEACLRNGGGGGLRGAHQSMPRPLQPRVKLKSVPHCVCVNDPGGTPTPAAPHAFPSTCLLCPGCGPVREDYAEECSRAHLLKQGRRGGLRPWA